MAEKLRNCPFCGSSSVDPERIATLTQQLAEADARVRVLDNTLDVERDAFRNMQMQKEALEARNGRLEPPSIEEARQMYGYSAADDWLHERLGFWHACIALRAESADERKEVQGE